jgi:hypothetical protein
MVVTATPRMSKELSLPLRQTEPRQQLARMSTATSGNILTLPPDFAPLIRATLARFSVRAVEIDTKLRRRLRHISEPTRIKNANPAPLALNNPFPLHIPQQLIHRLPAQRQHHPEPLL